MTALGKDIFITCGSIGAGGLTLGLPCLIVSFNFPFIYSLVRYFGGILSEGISAALFVPCPQSSSDPRSNFSLLSLWVSLSPEVQASLCTPTLSFIPHLSCSAAVHFRLDALFQRSPFFPPVAVNIQLEDLPPTLFVAFLFLPLLLFTKIAKHCDLIPILPSSSLPSPWCSLFLS